jgi:hypothetical protein
VRVDLVTVSVRGRCMVRILSGVRLWGTGGGRIAGGLDVRVVSGEW